MRRLRVRKVGHLWVVENWVLARVVFAVSFADAIDLLDAELLENTYGATLNGHLV